MWQRAKTAVFDWTLTWRFWTNATTAAFETSAAMLAASKEISDHFAAAPSTAPNLSPGAFPAWPLDGALFAPWASMFLTPQPPVAANPFQAMWLSMLPFASWMPAHQMFAPSLATAAIPSPFDPASYFTAARAGWTYPALPWTLYQTPLMTWLLTIGVPASVAAPAARASTSAMEAAEAARQQALQTLSALESFSTYRSDGGHASAQIIMWPLTADQSGRSKRQ